MTENIEGKEFAVCEGYKAPIAHICLHIIPAGGEGFCDHIIGANRACSSLFVDGGAVVSECCSGSEYQQEQGQDNCMYETLVRGSISSFKLEQW